MRLPFSRSAADPATAGDDAVVLARTRARRRLAGALVLLVVGVIGLPLVFDTKPRPLPADTPIVVPPREAPLPARPAAQPRPVPGAEIGDDVPAARPAGATAAASAAQQPAAANAAAPASAAATGKAPTRSGVTTASAPMAALAVASAPIVGVPAAPSRDAPAAAPLAAATRASQTAAAASSTAGRFVVQVGAYTDAGTLREARTKVERLGLKTYTQVIESESGKRTRVRVGPFATRDEAAAAARRLEAAGLPHNILAL